MKTLIPLLVLASGLGLVTGCTGNEAPATPTWAADVRPILLANCVRCHGYPAIAGAPKHFRLDRYDDMVTDDGEEILGAGSMADFIFVRSANRTMPPAFPLRDWEIETLENWLALRPDGSFDAPPAGGPAPGNRPPTMTIREATRDGSTGAFTLAYEILDPNWDAVTGTLTATRSGEDPVVVTYELHAGRGAVRWDTSALPGGAYRLRAELDDGSVVVEVDLDTLEVPPGASAEMRP